jgi:hypothetical protein
LIGGGVLAVALVAGGIFLATRGGGKKANDAVAQNVPPPVPAAANDKPAVAPEKPAVTPDKPADPPVAPAQKTISISVATTPPGADVFVGSEATSRGKTPIQLELARADGETTVTVRAEGFKEARRPVKLTMDAQLEIALAKDRHSSSSGGTTASGQTSGKTGQTSGKTGSGKTGKSGKDGKTSTPGSDDVLAPSF